MANYINENSVILTEEDAEEFMNEYYLDEGYIILEGQQAEEYLKRKQEEKYEKEEDEELNKDHKYGRVTGGGTRGQYKSKYNDYDMGVAKNNERKKSFDYNPKFKTAKEIEEHRKKYGDVMPNKLSKSEKDLAKAREKENNSEEYADKTLRNRFRSYYTTDKAEKEDRQKMNLAADAARRHYRRTHKNEASIFEQIEFI